MKLSDNVHQKNVGPKEKINGRIEMKIREHINNILL